MLFKKMYVLLLLGVLSLTTGCIEVTYLGSAGYMLDAPEKKVVVDGLYKDFVTNFGWPIQSGYVTHKIINGIAPFDDIDLMLITHEHGGHLEPPRVAAFLVNNPSVKIVTSPKVKAALETAIDVADVAVLDRVIAPVLEKDYDIVDIDVDGLAIRVSCAPHWDVPCSLYNFEFNLDGTQILFGLGAASGYVVNSEIDVLFNDAIAQDEISSAGLEPDHFMVVHRNAWACDDAGCAIDYSKFEATEAAVSETDNASFIINPMRKAVISKRGNKVKVDEIN